MKRYIIGIFVVLSTFLSSCSGGGEDNGGGGEIKGIDITAENIAGQWRLFSWNGTDINTKLFDVYVRFDAAGSVVLYQHVADYGYKQLKGTFVIDGTVLSGSYEGEVAWTNSYTGVVSEDLSTLTMHSIETSDICVYKKAVLPVDMDIQVSAEPFTRQSVGFTPFL